MVLGRAFVLVEQAAQDGSAVDRSVGKVWRGMIGVGPEKLKGSMGSSPVVVRAVSGEEGS